MAQYIRCPKCGFEGESVSYFSKHIAEVVIAALLTALLYFVINLATDPRACPVCGNHRKLEKLPTPPDTTDFATLRDGLSSPDAKVREHSISRLGDRGADARGVLPELHSLLDDPVRIVRVRAKWAIETIERMSGR